MSTITALVGTDGITTANSMAKINTNFTNLNTDKIETSYLDTDTSLAANSDTKIATQKAVKTYIDTSGGANASETVRGIVEEATDAEVTAGTATGGTGAKLIVTPAKLATRLSSLVKFGGTGAHGALALTSGATNIDLGSAAIVVKNYTSISITSTGSLTFTNPHANGTTIILKSQGAVTLTSSTAPMIVASSLGGAGGASVSNTNNGNTGSNGICPTLTSAGGQGGQSAAAGTGGTKSASVITADSLIAAFGKYPYLGMSSGGGSGRANGASHVSGVGGRAGGSLIIECAGALNFTTSSGISVAGANGGNAAVGGGGGGGGGGGFFLLLYNTLTANSGTITVSGGSAGSGITEFGGGGGASATTAGSNGSGNGGGAGATGNSLVAANTEFL